MKLICIVIYSLLITLTSINSGKVATTEYSPEELSSLHSLPIWETDSLRSPHDTTPGGHFFIAQDFIPIVLISDYSQPSPLFNFYLSLYDQTRPKHFYLII